MSNQKKKPRGKAPVAPNAQVQIRTNKTRKSSNGIDNDSNGGGAKKLRYSHLLEGMVGCGDMVLLEPLTENSLVENLKIRYDSGEIYVSYRVITYSITIDTIYVVYSIYGITYQIEHRV